MTNCTNITVRYGETDQMGVVYYSNYFRYFEVALTDLIKRLGYSYKQIEKEEGLFIPVINCNCTYKSPAKYDDQLYIKTVISNITNATLTINYKVYKEAGEDTRLLVEGHTTHAIVDKNFQSVDIKSKNSEFYARLDKLKNRSSEF